MSDWQVGLQDWIDKRLDFHRAERREAASERHDASSVGAMLELYELRSFLIQNHGAQA